MVCHAVRAELVLVALQLTMTDDDASLFLYFLRSRMNRWIEDVWYGRADRIASSAGNVLPVLGPQTVASTAARWRFDRRPEGQRHSSRQQFPVAAVHRRPQSLWRRSVPLGLHLRMIPSAMKRKWFVSSFHPSFFFFFFSTLLRHEFRDCLQGRFAGQASATTSGFNRDDRGRQLFGYNIFRIGISVAAPFIGGNPFHLFHFFFFRDRGWWIAVLAVVTVLGYAIFRHLKIKAVGYDTMQ